MSRRPTTPVDLDAQSWQQQTGGSTPEPARLTRQQRRAARRTQAEAGPQPGPRGWRGPGQGEHLYLPALDEFRGPSSQLCGVWPFTVGAGAPMIGVPVGRNLDTGGTVCCDEVSWFQRAGLIPAPIMLVLGLLGLGKSTFVSRKILGQYGMGILPMIFGDMKPDYVGLIRAIGGQVLELGPGAGALNVLDQSHARAAARRLTGTLRMQVLAEAHTRRHVGVSSLLTIARSEAAKDREESVIDAALRVLDDKWDPRHGEPLLTDLLQVLRDAPDTVRNAVLDRGERHRYDMLTEALEVSLIGLIGGGRLGDTFARATTEPMRLDRPVCFDVSRLRASGSSPEARAATLITCWNYGFGAINTAHTLADAGLELRRLYSTVLDEMWEVLRVGHGMPALIDAAVRTNRTIGTGITMITHSVADPSMLSREEDRRTAQGLLEKAPLVVCAGLPPREMPRLEEMVGLSQTEQAMLTGWSSPPAWDPVAGAETSAPGLGNFLIKVGGRPGIPFHLRRTQVEHDLGHDTSRLWADVSRIGQVSDLPPVDPEFGDLPAVRQIHRPPVPDLGETAT